MNKKFGWFFSMGCWAFVMIISLIGMFVSDPYLRIESKIAFWGSLIMLNMTVMHKPDGFHD